MNSQPLDSDQPVLVGTLVELQPMRPEHTVQLLAAAADGELWNLITTVIPSPATIEQYVTSALAGRVAGTMLPFTLIQRDTGRVVGSTRFWKIDRQHRKLEIGHTWLSESVQRSGINTEMKFLMLVHAFEVMDCIRVQFTTDELNDKSRAAILRIGATQEGIARNERIMPSGRKRNSVRFSIIDSEWPAVKAMLRARMER